MNTTVYNLNLCVFRADYGSIKLGYVFEMYSNQSLICKNVSEQYLSR